MPRVDSVASLIKGRRNYRLHVALYSTEFKDSIHTKKGPNSVLNAVFYDNTGYLNFTAWGSRAQSMNATLGTLPSCSPQRQTLQISAIRDDRKRVLPAMEN